MAEPTVNQPSPAPTRKVTAGVLGGATVTLVAVVLGAAGVDVPAEGVAAATTVVSFALSYVVKERVV